MPKIAVYKFFTFYIYSFDISERPHLHVIKNKKGYSVNAKIWIGDAEFLHIGDLNEREQTLDKKLTENNKEKLLNAFYEFKEKGETKTINLKLK